MSVFEQSQPARIRIETGTTLNVDAIVPCFIALYPDPEGSGKVQIAEKHQNPAQLAAMIEAAIRFGTIAGVMDEVFRNLTNGPTQATLQQYGPRPPGTPPDDIPAHIRNRRPGT